MESMQRLKKIMDQLRSPGGCEWDRAQSFETMKHPLIEEAYEIVDSIDRNHKEDLKEELGDLLFIVFFFARMAEEENLFNVEQIAQSAAEKLVRRHPHVFADQKTSDVSEILYNWEQIKKAEKPDSMSILDKPLTYLPALMRAFKMQEKAARIGFDWPDDQGIWSKLEEESQELKEAMNQKDERLIEEELGDLLFTVVNLSRHCRISPEMALGRATEKFRKRFQIMESMAAARGESLKEMQPGSLDALWNEAKQKHD